MARPLQVSSSGIASGTTTKVSLERSLPNTTTDQALWPAIRNRTDAISFSQYEDFIDAVLCGDEGQIRDGHRLLFSTEMSWPSRGDSSAFSEEFVKHGFSVSRFDWDNDNTVSAAASDASCGTTTTYQIRRDGDTANFYRRLNAGEMELRKTLREKGTSLGRFYGLGAYELLKTATEVFLLMNCGVKIENADFDENEEASRLENWSSVSLSDLVQLLSDYLGSGSLPYIERIVNSVYPDWERTDSPFCQGIVATNITCPCFLELIWSYWHEEGMLT